MKKRKGEKEVGLNEEKGESERSDHYQERRTQNLKTVADILDNTKKEFGACLTKEIKRAKH